MSSQVYPKAKVNLQVETDETEVIAKLALSSVFVVQLLYSEQDQCDEHTEGDLGIATGVVDHRA
jgi:hypothetical protein